VAVYPSLRGKHVLITGGAGGIGAAMVEAFAKQGALVSFIDKDIEAGRRLTDTVTAMGCAPVQFHACELRDIEATIKVVSGMAETFGPFFVLINNAGNDQAQPFDQVSFVNWDERVAVNLKHQFFLAQALSINMITLGGGSIINLGSVSWRIGATGVPVYATLKSAVTGLTKSLARELGIYNIRVNEIAPGWVMTQRQLQKGAANPQKFADYLTKQCLKSHLQPIDIAEMALWLAADESRFCTGQVFTVDAGVS
jgi:NAD(P)-dependent dehydrogenase (short-subunit alcohol dehydrogenase family)